MAEKEQLGGNAKQNPNSPDNSEVDDVTQDVAVLPLSAEAVQFLEASGVDTKDPESVRRLVAATLTTSLSRSPYPSPEMLREYDSYRAGFSDTVVSRIDREAAHRQALAEKETDGSERRMNRSQHHAFIIAVLGLLLAAGVGVYSRSSLVASIIAIVAVGGPSSATVLSRVLDRLR